MEQIKIRKAVLQDCNFLAEIILLAESTGAEIISYAKMFSFIPEGELKSKLARTLENTINGHSLTYKSYFIACVNEIPSAAASCYVEGENGESNHLMTGALLTAFNKSEVANAFSFLKEHPEIQIEKSKKAIQIDCVATLPEHRGKGLFSRIHDAITAYAKENAVKTSEIQVWKNNAKAIETYAKLGYHIVLEKKSHSDSSNGKILMKKEF